MLTPERYQLIIDQIEKHDVVKIQELINLTNASESTIRRDLSTLEERGFLKRVHGEPPSFPISDLNPICLKNHPKTFTIS